MPQEQESEMVANGSSAAFPCALGIVADDLTGACDAAVAFASVCPEVRVALGTEPVPQRGVWAISTDTRDVEASDAERSLQQVATGLPAGCVVFKKIDSVFRGNTAGEIASVLRWFQGDLIVVAPAYPALGRRVQDAVLHIGDGEDARRMALVPLLKSFGCEPACLPAFENEALLAEQLTRLRANGPRGVLCDATSHEHLQVLVRAARRVDASVVWVGSGGLAHALAAEYTSLPKPPVEPVRAGRVLFFIGSDHPATESQVVHFERLTGLKRLLCDECGPANSELDALLLVVRRGEPEDILRRAVGEVEPEQVGALFMTGGDTARLVCRALGIRALRLCREFAPGVPLAVAEGGRFEGVPVILKSGGFGPPTLLQHVAEAFSRKQRCLA